MIVTKEKSVYVCMKPFFVVPDGFVHTCIHIFDFFPTDMRDTVQRHWGL